jgi:hypothetical protein
MTPGEIVGDVIEYARETPVAEFIRNLACDVRESPLPVARPEWEVAPVCEPIEE